MEPSDSSLFHALPNELLEKIFRRVPLDDLQSVALVNRRFNLTSRFTLWRAPQFKERHVHVRYQIGKGKPYVKDISHLPIKVMKLSHIQCYQGEGKEMVDQLLELLDLTEVIVDTYIFFMNNLTEILRLPVHHLHTCYMRCEPVDLLEYLMPLEKCPMLIIDFAFHGRMSIENWAEYVKLPLIDVYTDFRTITLRNIQRYVDLATNIPLSKNTLTSQPVTPKFHLYSGNLTVQHIDMFRNLNLTTLHMAALEWRDHSLYDYLNTLRKNNQYPTIMLDGEGFCVNHRELAHILHDFRVPVMHTFALQIHYRRRSDERALVQLITERHLDKSNPVLTILDYDDGFLKGSRKKLKSAGIEVCDMHRNDFSSTDSDSDENYLEDSDEEEYDINKNWYVNGKIPEHLTFCQPGFI